MLQKPLNEWRLWRGKLQSAPAKKPVQKPPMVLPEIRSTLGGTSPPREPIWDEITRAYEIQSAEYWWRVKIREREYRSRETATPPYQRTCQACM